MNLFFLFTLCSSYFACLPFQHVLHQPQACTSTVDAIKKQLFNKPIKSIPSVAFPCFQQKKKVITDEENESLSWNALLFSKGGKTAFIAESNWQDQQNISRITILSREIPTLNGAKVGMQFDELRALVSDKIPSEPDGFLAFEDQKDSTVFYFLDISKYPKLAKGVDNLDEIPKQLKVEMIVIMGR